MSQNCFALELHANQNRYELELDSVRISELYDIVPKEQSFTETGKPPIPLKWVDTNKGDDRNPFVRSRLVVKDIKAKKKKEDTLFGRFLYRPLSSAAPPRRGPAPWA